MKRTFEPKHHRLDHALHREAGHREGELREGLPVSNEDWRRIHAAVQGQGPGGVVIIECGKKGRRYVKAWGERRGEG